MISRTADQRSRKADGIVSARLGSVKLMRAMIPVNDLDSRLVRIGGLRLRLNPPYELAV
jgi:hypothetical protein